MPFGDYSRLLLPNLPTDFSAQSLGGFVLDALKTPSVLVHLYLYLRPVLEIRLYRFIRRRLPKPTLADELSIKVALENDLIDWMVPSLGRRSEEEISRSNMSFFEDLLYELDFLRWWVLKRFGIHSSRVSRPSESATNARHRQEWLESLPTSIEQLQSERHPRTRRLQRQSAVPPAPEEVMRGEVPVMNSIHLPVADQITEQTTDFSENRVLPGEENRISQSPGEISNGGDTSELAPLGPFSAMPPLTSPPSDSENIGPPLADIPVERRLNSRSNTLFSRPSSPDTSSPASPRVRASLIHQNSDVITMQLELLGNRQPRHQGQIPSPSDNGAEQMDVNGESDRRRSITEFLDNLLSNQGQNFSTIVNSDTMDSDGLSNMTMGATPGTGNSSQVAISPDPATEQFMPRPTAADQATNLGNILPDSVEEPGQDNIPPALEGETTMENDFDSEIFPRISDPNVRPDAPTNDSLIPHRVTILSSHPVDSLASHLAAMITVVLFIPLESLYLRSLASSYLSCINAPPSLRSGIRPVGVWGGGGSRTDIIAYMGKLILMVGMQAAVNTSVWGIISGAAIRIGKRFCGWGTF
ncbi:hypothetical protein FE257_002220 [Aspergillus nanangensis]|uniref:Uncharacterized protein n=1 Tax=Aspergillus nanangensis TaxID=2582783 RepID=A0AAD4CEC0_ASPNN|nr:hypothetical protein FE257_002220 [Aspergillus nanangensis]